MLERACELPWIPMSGRDPLRPDDPDDWFGDSGTTAVQTEGRYDDDWLEGDPRAPRRPLRLPALNLRSALAVGALVVLLIVAGLAVGGVFSGGKSPASSPPTTTANTTTSHTPTHRPAQTALAGPTKTLSPGDTGTQVKLLQRALTRLGYAAGKADGIYGSSTASALKSFQQKAGLTADGVFGPKTLAALKTALRRRA